MSCCAKIEREHGWRVDYYIVDVFGKEPYSGNPLGVFICNDDVSSATMQRIAAELHFSEVTFITSMDVEKNEYSIRIFTPDVEIPFAGHPLLGSAYVISQFYSNCEMVIFKLINDTVRVSVNHGLASMEVRSYQESLLIDSEEAAGLISLENDDIDRRFPVIIASTGLPALLIPLSSVELLKKAKVNQRAFDSFIQKCGKANLYPFSWDNGLVYARCFMDDTGHLEDTATGSAASALGGYLIKNQYFGNSQAIQFSISQGTEIGKNAIINISACRFENLFSIILSGRVAILASGYWYI